MRKIFHWIILVGLFSCTQTSNKGKNAQTAKKDSKYITLLAKYRNISFDTLKVFSVSEEENKNHPFKGRQLDSSEVSLLSREMADTYINDPGYYACYRFPIDTSKVALITRTPSTYEPTSIRLFVLDRQQDTITDIIELSEIFGDAGDMMEKTSWLFSDHNRKLKAFMWVTQSYDHSVEDEKDTTVEKWNYYYLLDLSKQKHDTIQNDAKELFKRFASFKGSH
jgi:hypothetical protein